MSDERWFGQVRIYFRVECGSGCMTLDEAESNVKSRRGTRARFESDLRSQGWSKTVNRGWLCPNCAEKHKAAARQARAQASEGETDQKP